MPVDLKELVWEVFVPWLGLAGALAVPVFLLWRRHGAGPLLPSQRQRLVPWDLVHLGAVFAVWVMGQYLAVLCLFPFFPDAKPSELDPRFQLWISLLSWIIALPAVILFLNKAAETKPYQLGLSPHRWRPNLVAGCLAWLLLWPLVYGINLGVVWIAGPGEHLIERFLKQEGNGTDWMAALALVVLVAPVAEEIVFRGVLQSWFVKNAWAADLVMLMALVTAVVMGIRAASVTGPVLALVTAGAGYWLFEWVTRKWLPRMGPARAIYVSSLLFAAIHFDAWPQPIPLFFLALGFGFLAYRTQSLIGPIAAHAIFNAAGMLGLWLTQMAAS